MEQKMKITFVLPAIGKKKGEKYIKRKMYFLLVEE